MRIVLLLLSASTLNAAQICNTGAGELIVATLKSWETSSSGGTGRFSDITPHKLSEGWFSIKAGECRDFEGGRHRWAYVMDSAGRSWDGSEGGIRSSMGCIQYPTDAGFAHEVEVHWPDECAKKRNGKLVSFFELPDQRFDFASQAAPVRNGPPLIIKSGPRVDEFPITPPATETTKSRPSEPVTRPSVPPVNPASYVTFRNQSPYFVEFALAIDRQAAGGWTTDGWYSLNPGEFRTLMVYPTGGMSIFVHGNFTLPTGEKRIYPGTVALCIDHLQKFRIPFADRVPCNAGPGQVRALFTKYATAPATVGNFIFP